MKKISLNILKVFTALILGAFLFYLTFKNLNIKDILIRISKVNLFYIVAAFAVHGFSYFIIGARWRTLIGPGAGVLRLSVAVMTGYLFSLLFFRIGDVLKCFLIKDAYPVSDSGAGAVVGKIMDSIVVISCAVIPVFFMSNLSPFLRNLLLIPVVILVLAVALIVISAFLMPVQSFILKLINRLPFKEKLSGFYKGFNKKIVLIAKEPLRVAFAFLITVLLWSVYALFFYLTIYAVGLKPKVLSLIFILGVTTLGMNIPVSVGFIGTFHYSFYISAVKTGVSPELASAAGLILHLSKISAHGLMGVAGLCFQKVPSYKEIKKVGT